MNSTPLCAQQCQPTINKTPDVLTPARWSAESISPVRHARSSWSSSKSPKSWRSSDRGADASGHRVCRHVDQSSASSGVLLPFPILHLLSPLTGHFSPVLYFDYSDTGQGAMQRRSSLTSPTASVKRATFSEEPVRTEPMNDSEDDKKNLGFLKRIDVAGWLKDVTKAEWDILLVSTCLKLLLFPA